MNEAFEAEVNVDALAGDLETVRDYLRWAMSRFLEADLYYGHGTDSAWDEATHLVLQALYLPLDIDERILDARLTHVERQKVIKWVYRRVVDRVPLPYLTKNAWFAGMKFYVDQRVIVPRSPVGELIRNGFEPWVDETKVHRVLDLCTGSGCIGIGAAYVFDEAEVTLSDLSEDALEVANRNIQLHNLNARVSTVHSDLFENLKGQKYDLIISNPPYVDANDLAAMPVEYLKEPVLALGSGEDGLDITREILIQAENYLTKEGTLIVEVGNSQYALQDEFANVPFTWLSFEDGGDGVFLLTRDELIRYRDEFVKGAKNAG
ncbi:50S ribosomal protein L3 N(5)-glutamine methyltransferase [Fangia hongkongensis]|uniref:50S ribosomal protein L3 N(5)-glutamine methyltransferase n=1 Tax=Fangia hongkongensis TaxID=270495 RepID=UPI000374DC99|nr:50S ribosomal protein L3 N(5)-glutamine methyltransferase [Fangia hongkongensis]MBK2126153.1 50S ribosomal protein L3 N(5)-glutamine methyltransferase [Fangia hongkongensis]